jgi:hypothetical protein
MEKAQGQVGQVGHLLHHAHRLLGPGRGGRVPDDDFVDGIERQVEEKGILSSFFMSRTFSFLRSNDLIYGPAIRSYMMGEAPPAFDLLYWNGDGTNLPAKMAVEYLRGLCQGDRFAKAASSSSARSAALRREGAALRHRLRDRPHRRLEGSFDGVRQMGSKDKTFILSESGHIAGIVNPPSKGKYGHYTNEDLSLTDARLAGSSADLPRRVVVAALGGMAGEAVGRAGARAHPGDGGAGSRAGHLCHRRARGPA